MSTQDPAAGGRQPTEEELRAAYEEQVKQIRVEHVLLEDVVTLINLGMRRTGLAPGTESERDPEQVRMAIEAVRAMLPLLERSAPSQTRQIRDALSQLQLAFVRIEGQAGGEATESTPPDPGAPPQEPPPPKPGEPGPAQRSGKLWIPGQ